MHSSAALAEDAPDEQGRGQAGHLARARAPARRRSARCPAVSRRPTVKKLPTRGEWRFDFHGFLTMPVRAGFNTRAGAATTEQHTGVLHAPPVVPDYRDSFTYTLGRSQSVRAAQVLVRQLGGHRQCDHPGAHRVDRRQLLQSPEQSGISDAFLNFRLPNLAKNTHFEVNVGAFTNRYGVMGEYDEGKYATPVIARINGVGENIIAKFGFGNAVLASRAGHPGAARQVSQ